MGAFLLGSLGVIVLYAVTQKSAAGRVSEGSNLLADGFRRLLAPSTAGIKDRSRPDGPSARTLPVPGGGGGGGSPPKAMDLPSSLNPETQRLLDGIRLLIEQKGSAL